MHNYNIYTALEYSNKTALTQPHDTVAFACLDDGRPSHRSGPAIGLVAARVGSTQFRLTGARDEIRD
jgi:hypothetical protein